MLNLSQNGCSLWVAASTEQLLTPTAVALGKFDGVHIGHQLVIEPILHSLPGQKRQKSGQQLPQNSPNDCCNIYSTVVTFDPHPQEFFSGQARTLLTPLEEKVEQLRSLGVQQLVLLPFDRELSSLSPQDFVAKILVQKLQSKQISIGEDFCFGQKRTGNAQDLQKIAAHYNIPVTIVPLQTDTNNLPKHTDCINSNQFTDDGRISTSLIRQSLETGDIFRANRLLGRPYSLTGVVIVGQKLGRTIGFPTANLELPKNKFLPRKGVYAVGVRINNEHSTDSSQQLGVMNIGNRPTVNGTHTTVEIHLFDWSGDLYGKKLVVEIVKFLRPEQKFSGLDELKNQIQIDCTVAREFFSTY